VASYIINHFEADEGGGVSDYVVTSNIPTGSGTISNPWIVAPGDQISFTCNFASSGDSVTGLNSGIWGVTSVTLSLFSPPSRTVLSGSNLTDSIFWINETYYVRRESFVSDPNPDQFTFTDIQDVAIFTFYNSNTITLSGMNTTATASVTNGLMSQNGGSFVSGPLTASVGDTFQLRHRSNSAYSATKTTTLTIGTTSESFITTTIEEPDPNPNQFTFNDIQDVALFTFYNSNTITLSGMNTTATASVTNGFMSQNGGAFTDQNVTASNGDTFQLRHRSNSAYSATKTTTLTIGTTSESFITTTIDEPDPNPDQFTFNDVSNVNPSSTNFSNTITLTGMDTSATASVSGALLSKNGGGYVSGPVSANNGDTFRLRVIASASYSTAVNATLTVGTTSDTYTVTTRAIDDDPAQFNIGANQTNLGRNITVNIGSFTVSGMDSGATQTFTASGTASPQISKNNNDFFTSLTGIQNGDTIYTRGTTSSSYSASTTATVTAGATSDSATLTTESNPTAGDNEISIGITSGTISLDDIISFFAGTGLGRPTNLGSFYRGGTYVPNITTNSGIPTSGTISITDFYGSATEFTFVMNNSYKAVANEQSNSSQNMQVFWSTGDWDVGPNGSLDVGGAEYRYSDFTIQSQTGTPAPQVVQGTSTFSTSNTTFQVQAALVNQNNEYFTYGTLTIQARSVADNSKVVSRTVSWSFLVFGTQ